MLHAAWGSPRIGIGAAVVALGLGAAACDTAELEADDDATVSDDTSGDDTTTGTDDDASADDDTTPPPDDDTTPPVDWPTDVVVNEFMADNDSSAHDEEGNPSDWVELYNPTGTDIPLEGYWLTDDLGEPSRHVLGANLIVRAGGFLLLWADGTPELGVTHLGFSLEAEGESIGLYTPDGFPCDRLQFGTQVDDVAAARQPDGSDTWTYVWHGTPGASNIPIQTAPFTVLPAGEAWSFWDQGSVDAGWNTVGYDDHTWPVGFAPLGYGDTYTTTVGFGDNPNNKFVTTWFRHTFTISPPEGKVTSVSLSLRCDDGAVVHWDGAELLRHNMPAGAVTADTLASASVSDAAETTFSAYYLEPGWLTAGEHTVAVEVHQADPASSDIGFDLGLSGEVVVSE